MNTRLFGLALCFCAALFAVISHAVSADTPEEVLTVATRHVPPFAIKRDDGTWAGVSIDLWHTVSTELGWRTEFVDLGLSAMLEAVAQGEVAAAVGALSITSQREVVMDFSHPFLTSGLAIAVPRDGGGAWLKVLQRLFSGPFLGVVALLGGVLLAVGVLVWFFERRRNPQFGGSPAEGIGSGLWWSAVTMTTVGYGDKAPQTTGGRALALVWMFASVIVISSFTAAIASALTVGELDGKVKGKDDLGRVRVVTVEGSTSAAYLRDRGDDFVPVGDLRDALRELAEGKADAVVYDEPILRYFVKQEFAESLVVLPGTFQRQDYGIALPSGSPLRESLNRDLLRHLQGPAWRATLVRYIGSE
jgi:ABC-type amino acid transport substrate-binding protein